jgi:hypothetical protein
MEISFDLKNLITDSCHDSKNNVIKENITQIFIKTFSYLSFAFMNIPHPPLHERGWKNIFVIFVLKFVNMSLCGFYLTTKQFSYVSNQPKMRQNAIAWLHSIKFI